MQGRSAGAIKTHDSFPCLRKVINVRRLAGATAHLMMRPPAWRYVECKIVAALR